MMSSAMGRGMQMNGDVPSIRGKVRPMSPLVLSLVQSSLTLMERHWIPLCGHIGWVLLLPPSKTITSLSILLVVILSWVIGTTTSLRTRSCFLVFFSSLTKMTMKDYGWRYICSSGGSTLCAEWGICRSLGKNVDPGRRTRWSVQREWLSFLSGVSYLYSSVAARPRWHN